MTDLLVFAFIVISSFLLPWWIDTWYEERPLVIIRAGLTYYVWGFIVVMTAVKFNLIKYLM